MNQLLLFLLGFIVGFIVFKFVANYSVLRSTHYFFFCNPSYHLSFLERENRSNFLSKMKASTIIGNSEIIVAIIASFLRYSIQKRLPFSEAVFILI